MNRNFCYALLLSILSLPLVAQQPAASDTSYWRIGGASSLTFSQVSLTNWAAGGQNSVAINANYGMFANRVKGRGKWENSMDLAYGLVKQGSNNFQKSDDLINIVTKYSYSMNKNSGKWFFSALMDFRTQFYEGFDAESNEVLISDAGKIEIYDTWSRTNVFLMNLYKTIIKSTGIR